MLNGEVKLHELVNPSNAATGGGGAVQNSLKRGGVDKHSEAAAKNVVAELAECPDDGEGLLLVGVFNSGTLHLRDIKSIRQYTSLWSWQMTAPRAYSEASVKIKEANRNWGI